MDRRPPSGDPPAWAEAVLRALLDSRNRETVSGDLLEEYREVVVPTSGVVRARVWYLRQVLSFMTPHALVRAVVGSEREGEMANNLSRASLLWTIAASLTLAVIVALLVRSNFGPPLGLNVLVPIALALAVSTAASMRSRADIRPLLRAGLIWGGLLAVVLLVRLLFDVFAPVDPVERFLAQSRSDYSEFDYPRRWLPAVAVVMIFMGAGFRVAGRTGRVGKGTLAAMSASTIGSLVYIAVVALGNMLPMGPQDPLIHTPAGLAPVLLMFSAVLGTVGAMFGRGSSVLPPLPFTKM